MLLLNIGLTRLRNEEHLQFITDIDRLLQDRDLEAFKIDTLYPTFKEAWMKEKAILEYVRKSEFSDIIKAESTVRDGIFRAIALKIKMDLTPGSDPLLRTHAERINLYLRHYRKTYQKVITEKNSTYRKFIHDLQEECATEVAALSLTERLAQLAASCSRIEDKMDNRQFFKGQRFTDLDVSKVRKLVDQHYNALKAVLNGTLVLNDTPEGLELQSKFNGLVLLYKQTLKTRYQSAKKQGKVPAKAEEPAEALEKVG